MEIEFKPFDINNPPERGRRIIVKAKGGYIAVADVTKSKIIHWFHLDPVGVSGYDYEWDFEIADIVEWADITDM